VIKLNKRKIFLESTAPLPWPFL